MIDASPLQLPSVQYIYPTTKCARMGVRSGRGRGGETGICF